VDKERRGQARLLPRGTPHETSERDTLIRLCDASSIGLVILLLMPFCYVRLTVEYAHK
jgi:hypothetical protein